MQFKIWQLKWLSLTFLEECFLILLVLVRYKWLECLDMLIVCTLPMKSSASLHQYCEGWFVNGWSFWICFSYALFARCSHTLQYLEGWFVNGWSFWICYLMHSLHDVATSPTLQYYEGWFVNGLDQTVCQPLAGWGNEATLSIVRVTVYAAGWLMQESDAGSHNIVAYSNAVCLSAAWFVQLTLPASPQSVTCVKLALQ